MSFYQGARPINKDKYCTHPRLAAEGPLRSKISSRTRAGLPPFGRLCRTGVRKLAPGRRAGRQRVIWTLECYAQVRREVLREGAQYRLEKARIEEATPRQNLVETPSSRAP